MKSDAYTLSMKKKTFELDARVSKGLNPYQINDDIFAKLLPPFCSHFTNIDHSLRVICVNMEDGGVDHTGNISTVRGRTRTAGICCKANLWVEREKYKKEREKIKCDSRKIIENEERTNSRISSVVVLLLFSW